MGIIGISSTTPILLKGGTKCLQELDEEIVYWDGDDYVKGLVNDATATVGMRVTLRDEAAVRYAVTVSPYAKWDVQTYSRDNEIAYKTVDTLTLYSLLAQGDAIRLLPYTDEQDNVQDYTHIVDVELLYKDVIAMKTITDNKGNEVKCGGWLCLGINKEGK